MGTSQSREGQDLTDSDSEYQSQGEEEEEEEIVYDAVERQSTPQSSTSAKTLDDIDAKLKSLKLKYPNSGNTTRPVKLYIHIGGNTPNAKWVVSEKLTSYNFVKIGCGGDEEEEEGDETGGGENSSWVLKVGSKVRAKVSSEMQLKMFGEQRRVDFVDKGVWALKFFTDEEYRTFVTKFQDCLFENVYGLNATEENKIKVYGKEFIGWVKPEIADDTMWEDADDDKGGTPVRPTQDLMEEFEEAANGGVQSLALGALDNSFLVNDSGVQVYRNSWEGCLCAV